jgi:hypothetical protein
LDSGFCGIGDLLGWNEQDFSQKETEETEEEIGFYFGFKEVN